MRELAAGVHMLGATKGGHVRAYLLETNGELSLVDTLFENDGSSVLDAIRKLGRKPSDLKRIVLTHAHRSHLGGLAALKRASGAAVLAHEWEADIISGDRPAQSVGLKPTAPFRTYPFQVGIFLNRPKHRPVPIDESIGDGGAFGPLQVLYVPGHSPGHLAFHADGCLFSGDVLFAGSVGRTDLPGADWDTLVETLRALTERFPAETVVYSGHGPPTTLGDELARNPFLAPLRAT